MADGGHRLAGAEDRLDEGERPSVRPELIGIEQAAGQKDGVELVGGHVIERRVDADRAADLEVLHALDGAGRRRHDGCDAAGLVERPLGDHQLALLEAVGGEDGDLASGEIMAALRHGNLLHG